MPVKLREFYWRELLSHKEAEKESYESAMNKGRNVPNRITNKR
jgi:hypothetical protein